MSCPFEIDVVRWLPEIRVSTSCQGRAARLRVRELRSKAESLRSILNESPSRRQGETNESSPKVFVDSVMEKIGREGAPARLLGRRGVSHWQRASPSAPLAAGWTAHRIATSNDAHHGAAASDRSAEMSESNGSVIQTAGQSPQARRRFGRPTPVCRTRRRADKSTCDPRARQTAGWA